MHTPHFLTTSSLSALALAWACFSPMAMAQTGGILALNTYPDPENYWTYFLGIDDCRFKKMVVPGDTVIIKCELLAPIRRGIVKMRAQAFVSDSIVCEATVSAILAPKAS